MSRVMLPFVLGMLAAGAILWARVENCRAASATRQCAIWIDSGGVRLAEIQWPQNSVPQP